MAKTANLNLLVHFDALMRCRSISRAAADMEISQPAMSGALSRLRVLFNDPMFVREDGQWQPTTRAHDLYQQFRPLIDRWRIESVPSTAFDPFTVKRAISVYASDYLQYALMPKLLAALGKAAPGIEVRLFPAKLYHGLSMVETNHVELVIGHYPSPSPGLRARFLYEERAVCIVRKGHPCLRRTWGIDQFLAYPHADLAAHTRNFSKQIDDALLALDRTRRIGTTLSSYLACPYVVGATDFIATLPHSVASGFQKQSDTAILEVPFALPLLNVSLYWHERHHGDHVHAWVRQFIADSCAR
jgi:DNA-binding transcriptional LysR family regulator